MIAVFLVDNTSEGAFESFFFEKFCGITAFIRDCYTLRKKANVEEVMLLTKEKEKAEKAVAFSSSYLRGVNLRVVGSFKEVVETSKKEPILFCDAVVFDESTINLLLEVRAPITTCLANFSSSKNSNSSFSSGLIYIASDQLESLRSFFNEESSVSFCELFTTIKDRGMSFVDVSSDSFYSVNLKRTLTPFVFKVNSKDDLKSCKKALLERGQKGIHFTSRVNKRVEDFLSFYLVEVSHITPNVVTIVTNLLAYVVAALFLLNNFLLGLVLAFLVSITDGLDGKIARLRGTSSKVGELEHSFDTLYEEVWYASFSLAVFSVTGDFSNVILGLLIIILNSFIKHLYMQFKASIGVPLTTYSRTDRIFAVVDGRRNVYLLYFLLGFVVKNMQLSLILSFVHSAITALFYSISAIRHLRKL
ncbi:MAG: CDP-alcohol phosphatidyltransferase family protein [Thermoproteota archaeon]